MKREVGALSVIGVALAVMGTTAAWGAGAGIVAMGLAFIWADQIATDRKPDDTP